VKSYRTLSGKVRGHGIVAIDMMAGERHRNIGLQTINRILGEVVNLRKMRNGNRRITHKSDFVMINRLSHTNVNEMGTTGCNEVVTAALEALEHSESLNSKH
jgi:hypothetical protein